MPRPATTTQRGYGNAHQQERARWKPLVDRGETYCHAKHCLRTTRHIAPGESWHLGHNDDRTAWTGPEHATCNTTDGAQRGNQQRHRSPPRERTPHHPQGW